MKISVLIAVYNTERYLRQCLDSLLGQTMADWEALCVDDCSTDGSLGILEEYAAKDGRIDVTHLDRNHGHAHARNVGLKKATGDIIVFLDSDDWLSADALQSAVDVFEGNPETDCVLFQCIMHYDSYEKEYPMDGFDAISGKEAFAKSLDWGLHGIYAIKAEIHKRYPYDESLHAYSDDNITTRLHYLASREVRQCTGKYFYRQNMSSVTHKISADRFDILKAQAIMKHHIKRLGIEHELIVKYENVRWLTVVDVCMFYYLHHKELPSIDARYGRLVIRRTWESIELTMLDDRSHHRRFGFMPLRFSWALFWMEEKVYFFLRGMLGRNKEI